jgi:hypothetical protein
MAMSSAHEKLKNANSKTRIKRNQDNPLKQIHNNQVSSQHLYTHQTSKHIKKYSE